MKCKIITFFLFIYIFVYTLILTSLYYYNISSNYENMERRLDKCFKKEMYYFNRNLSYNIKCDYYQTTNENNTLLSPFSLHIDYVKPRMCIYCNSKEYIVAIQCRPSDFLKRYVMRKIKNLYNKYQFIFFIGLSKNKHINVLINEENNKYHDIIQFNFLSSYYNCTIQIKFTLNYIYNNCKNYKWIIKLDIDTFINFKRFDNIEDEIYRRNIGVIAYFINKGVLKCNTSTKWNLPCSDLLPKKHPSFPTGACYIINNNDIECIVNSLNKGNNIWIEDLNIGFIINGCKSQYYDVSNESILSYNKINYYINYKKMFIIHGYNSIQLYHSYINL